MFLPFGLGKVNMSILCSFIIDKNAATCTGPKTPRDVKHRRVLSNAFESLDMLSDHNDRNAAAAAPMIPLSGAALENNRFRFSAGYGFLV